MDITIIPLSWSPRLLSVLRFVTGLCYVQHGMAKLLKFPPVPMFAKVEVNGSSAHPLFDWLRSQKGGLVGNKIRWNFTKFLVARDGTVLQRSAPNTDPAPSAGHRATAPRPRPAPPGRRLPGLSAGRPRLLHGPCLRCSRRPGPPG